MTMSEARYCELKTMLDERQVVLRREIQASTEAVFRLKKLRKPIAVVPKLAGLPVKIKEEIEETLLRWQMEALQQVDESLCMLDDGQYGDCLDCSKPVEVERLRALPFAVLCLTCSERPVPVLKSVPRGKLF